MVYWPGRLLVLELCLRSDPEEAVNPVHYFVVSESKNILDKIYWLC